MTLALAATAIPSAVCSPVQAADWPQWQGPDRNAVSTETGLLKQWPEAGPPLAWKITGLGGGYSSPAVAAGRMYGIGTRDGQQLVWCISEADGKPLWSTPVAEALSDGMPQGIEGPGCTPTIDGDRLYVVGHGGDVVCLQTADGKILWQRHLVNDFGGKLPTWRFNESPLVDGDKVVVTPGGTDATLVALDKQTGKEVWRSQLPAPAEPAAGAARPPEPGRGRRGRGSGSGAGYSSAIAIDFEGQRQYVQLTAKALIGVAADSGKLLWKYEKPANRMGINCSSPVYHDGMLFASSAYGAGGGLVKLSKQPDGTVNAEEVYFTQRMQNQHGGMVVFDGCLYGADGGNEGGYLTCIDFKTGERLWSERDEERAKKGSLALADGLLYYRVEDGTMLLVEPSRTGYVERGRFEPPGRTRSPAWAHPVIANGKLYLRDQDQLLCYDIKAKTSGEQTSARE